MSEANKPSAGQRLARLRRGALTVSSTPLHPQWFSFRAKNLAAEAVAAGARGHLLDIGCGDGSLRRRLREGCRYCGLDSLVTGDKMYSARPDVFADASRLPFRESSFDEITLLDVLEHLAEPRVTLREASRVLKPGGVLYLSVPCLYPLHDEPHDYQRPTLHGLRHWLTDAGFDVRAIEPRGAPAETVALLANIAIARLVSRAIRRFLPFALLLVLVAPLIAIINGVGWIVGRLDRRDRFMPFAYWAVARRVAPRAS